MSKRTFRPWDKETTGSFQEKLLRWYESHRRELPWRDDPTPYRVWISEIMLQQTQVAAVLPYFERFLRRFPDLVSLAEADEADVLAHWAGLGYYSRARNLRRTAAIIMDTFGGNFPQKMADVAKLPGIGRYTSGAILSIAFGQPYPVVDGNVRRVISRLHAIMHPPTEEFFWNQASMWLPKNHVADFNQAVMELGALVCAPQQPKCDSCPVHTLCQTCDLGIQDRVPAKKARIAPVTAELVVVVIEHNGFILLCQKQDASYIPGEWGLPVFPVPAGGNAGLQARALIRMLLHDRISVRPRGLIRHSISNRRLLCHIFHAETDRNNMPFKKNDSHRWATKDDLTNILTSSLYMKAIKAAFSV